jgi:hypothetical protein
MSYNVINAKMMKIYKEINQNLANANHLILKPILASKILLVLVRKKKLKKKKLILILN